MVIQNFGIVHFKLIIMEGSLRQTNMQISREVRTADEKEIIGSTARKLIREGRNVYAFSVERILMATQKELENKFVANDLTYYVIKAIACEIIESDPFGIESLFDRSKHCHYSEEEDPNIDYINTSQIYMALTIKSSDSFKEKYSYEGNVCQTMKQYVDTLDSRNNLELAMIDGAFRGASFLKDLVINNLFSEDQFDIEQRERIANWKDEFKVIVGKIKKTLHYKALIYSTFEEFVNYDRLLLDEVYEAYITKKSHALRSNAINYPCYNFVYEMLEFPYYELKYEDYLLFVCKLIRFMTGLNLSLEFTDDLTLYLKISGKDSTFELIADKFKYQMQLKNYAAYYTAVENRHREEIGLKPIGLSANEETKLMIQSYAQAMKSKSIFRYYELDENFIVNFPPYLEFEKEKCHKFSRYTPDDELHICPNDPELSFLEIAANMQNSINSNDQSYNESLHDEHAEPKCCSKFRNIDRLRLILQEVDSILSFKNMSSGNIFMGFVFCNNHVAYHNRLLKQNTLMQPANILNSKCQYEFVELVKNFYGEKLAFYFLFLYKMMKWLLFPIFSGIFLFSIGIIYKSQKEVLVIANMSTYDISNLLYCVIYTIWAKLFLDSWTEEEMKQSFYWGTNKSDEVESNREEFIPDIQERFIFNHNISRRNRIKVFFKSVFSNLVIVLMVTLTLLINYKLFKIKREKELSDPTDLMSPIMIAAFNSIQIKVMTFIYKFVMTLITDWENNPTQTQFENALALKFIFFEFINNYSSPIYIAFFKRMIEGQCGNGDNCMAEMTIQIYILLLVNLGINLFDLAYPYFLIKYRSSKYKEQCKKVHGSYKFELKPNSLEYSSFCEEYCTTMGDYTKTVIEFGFVALYGVVCPLTPLLVCLLLYIQRFLDAYKVFYLSRVTFISKANGVEVFRLIFKIIYVLGMTNSIAIIVFTELDKNIDFKSKLLVFAAVENIIILLMLFLRVNGLPQWFDKIDLARQLYEKMYYNKYGQHLPHHFLKESNSMIAKVEQMEGINYSRTLKKGGFESENDN